MAFDRREGPLMDLKVDPMLDELSEEPRFKALLKKMNLE
jgi:hypothetical protein